MPSLPKVYVCMQYIQYTTVSTGSAQKFIQHGAYWPLLFSLNQPSGPIQSLRRNDCKLSVCLPSNSVPLQKNTSRWTGDFWSKSVSLILAYLRIFFIFFVSIFIFCFKFFWVQGSLQTHLLFIIQIAIILNISLCLKSHKTLLERLKKKGWAF